jgi:hypothetical protein
MSMADNDSPVKKKKYEKPSITDPETGRSGPRTNYGPVGATGCSAGDVGSACEDGNSPSGPPEACSEGNTPKVLNCGAGTSADDVCMNGTDANRGCSTGTRFAGDCENGDQPQGGICNAGGGLGS